MGRDIFAHHAHVFPASVREDGTVNALLRTMDACNIARCVTFAPFSQFVGDVDANRWLADAIYGNERLEGFGVINFDSNNMESQVDAILEMGFKGIKIHPAFQKIDLLSEKAMRVYARAQQLGLFISFHTGTHWYRLNANNVLMYDELAWNFPKLCFSMEHVGGYCFFREAVAVIINNAHHTPRTIYAGMTSVCDTQMNRNWYLSDKQIADLIWQTGADGLIFGLDFPYNDVPLIRQAIDRFMSMHLSAKDLDGIFGTNLECALNMKKRKEDAT